MTTIEKYLQASDEVSFKYNKAGAKIWYRAHAILETGVIDTGKANGWSCDHDIKINRFQAALILEKYGLTIEQFIDAEKEFYATYYPEETNINEPNPDDYAVTEDALEVAVNAEIQNANTAKINDLKWEIRYTKGSINDLDKNHIAHAPNDQSLKERRTELVNELDNLKAQLAEIEPNTTPQVDPIIIERETARNEYYELNHVRNLIEKDVDRIERLRGRCKVGSPKYKEYCRMLADVDPIIRAFGDKYITAQDRYNNSLTLRTDEERAATQKAIDEHNKDLDARGIKYFATVRYYPHGHEGEDMENFFKDCQTLKEATDFVSQEDIDGVYVGGIYDAGWEITDRKGNIVADHNTGIKMTNTTQAGFLKDKINRDAQPSGDNVFNLLPTLDELNDFSETDPYFMDDDAEYTERDARFNYGERYAAALTEKLRQYDPTVEVTYDIDYDFDDEGEDVYYLKFDGIYRSPYTLSGIESAFHSLKKNIAEEEFMKSVDGTLDDKIAALHKFRKKQVRDSLNRAIKQCIRNRIGYLKSHNSKMEKYEYELLLLLQKARRELEVA